MVCTNLFHKPNSEINYSKYQVSSIIKQLPLSVESRISKLSFDENVFIQAASVYQEALKRAGYNHKLSYKNSDKDNSSNNNINNNNNNNNNKKNKNITTKPRYIISSVNKNKIYSTYPMFIFVKLAFGRHCLHFQVYTINSMI